jgi:hypothetical protein
MNEALVNAHTTVVRAMGELNAQLIAQLPHPNPEVVKALVEAHTQLYATSKLLFDASWKS